MSSQQDKCLNCGGELAGGLCRRCLLLAGMGPAPAATSTGWIPPTPAELSEQLPKYRVLELLGRGGMGAVYKGWQTSLERDVAIKVLPPTFLDEEFTARFKQEARTMARLSHPAIVNVYDFDETASGLCYIVMEYIEGTDVQRMIASEGKLPTEHALAISINVCGALSYAHEHGIIHRDIKPANVMVDTEGRVKVADFGLAKVTRDGAALLTGTNVTLGTPGYIAPEVLTAGLDVDGRADLYAVGVMLYAMLTGKVPHGRFEPATARVPGLDPRFDGIVNRAMQAERDARYASAAELRADLTKIITGPVDQANAQFAQAASNAQAEKRSRKSTRTQSRGPFMGVARTKARVALLGLAAAIFAMGLFAWRPWNHGVGQATVVTGVSPANRSDATNAPEKTAMPADRHIVVVATTPIPDAAPAPTTPAPAPHISVSPTPIPATAAPAEVPKPETVVQKWFRQVDAPQEEVFQKQVLKPFTTGVASLRARYLAALDAAILKASAANQLADALAWRTEKRLFEAAQNVPPSDDGVPAGVEALRVDFRQQLVKLDQERAARAKALLAQYDAILAQNQTLLTEHQRLDDALLLEQKRDEIARAWLDPPALIAIPATAPLASKNQPFENSLGMKFVAVPITGGPTSGKLVLFSVWDTRVQDYEVFVQETKRDWEKPDFQQGPTHPATLMDWSDAHDFCQWLTEHERTAGRLPAGFSYRLPSDHEWSCAVGIGEREDAAKPPGEKSGQINEVYPWGTEWPPPKGAGNFAGEEYPRPTGKDNYTVIDGYNDGFVNTSPVGSFAANRFGLFDMGGNVWQWCEDWFNEAQKYRVQRGSSWMPNVRNYRLSSFRLTCTPNYRSHAGGFRCVLAPVSPAPPVSAAPVAAAAPSASTALLLASKDAGAPLPFGPGQIIDLIALLDLSPGAARGNTTAIYKERGRLRIEGDPSRFSEMVQPPVAILGSEYELKVGVGKEFGTAVWVKIPLATGWVTVGFFSTGTVDIQGGPKHAATIFRENAWPAGQPITLKLRVKIGTGGLGDELETRVGAHPSVIWHGQLADYEVPRGNSAPRFNMSICRDVKFIESFSLRMIQGEAQLLTPAASLASPSPRPSPASVASAAPKPETDVSVPVDFKFTAVDGREVDLAKLRGKVVLVDFWATWCGPCMGEVPHVVEAYHRFHDQGFEIVGISFDEDKVALRRVTQEKDMPWPQYFDGKLWQNDYGLKFGIHSLPTMWLIDRQGRVATTNGREDLASKVEKLLAGETP